MDDLISRKAVAEKMKNRRDYVGRPSDPDCIIADEPSVPAVPLDKLCELLCGMDNKPYCDDCRRLGIECDYRKCCSPGHWKEFLTKWMEEQDAAD